MLNDASVASAGSYVRTYRRIRNSKKIATIRNFHQNICVNPTIRSELCSCSTRAEYLRLPDMIDRSQILKSFFFFFLFFFFVFCFCFYNNTYAQQVMVPIVISDIASSKLFFPHSQIPDIVSITTGVPTSLPRTAVE